MSLHPGKVLFDKVQNIAFKSQRKLMSLTPLTQNEADNLLKMEKHRKDNSRWDYPFTGGKICIPLASPDNREEFLMDINRSSINLSKVTYQNRARKIIVLVRLDIGGAPHRNPDGDEISCPHVHLYKEGYGVKWAYPVPANNFSNTSDLWGTLENFMEYCNITKRPNIVKNLFV